MKWYFIAMAIMMLSMYAFFAFDENNKTRRYEACMAAIKDVDKCEKAKKD